jgi:hypothetical protein
MVCVSCGKPQSEALSADLGSNPSAKLELSQLGKSRRITLLALTAKQHEINARLGAHQVTCETLLSTVLEGNLTSRVEQKVVLRVDRRGQYRAEKTTHPQYGQEVIWTGGWLYPRLRYSSFIRRRPRPGEPEEIVDRLVGMLPAYLRLLGRFLTLKPDGREQYEGRPTVRIVLSLNDQPAAPPSRFPRAQQWRASMSVKTLTGRVLLDAKTGAPLQVSLNARWSFHPPSSTALPATGIPTQIEAKRAGTTELIFRQKATALGQIPLILAPAPEEVTDPRRLRLELERQVLTGELPLSELQGTPIE